MRSHVDLFSGIGGFALAARWAGVETIAFAEIDSYASRVLTKHWPNVRNYGDVRNVPAIEDVWLVTGGVPCQPASIAGQRRGVSDDRWLWPEAVAAVKQLKPTWLCLENPLGILSLEKPIMSFDLEGYGNLIEAALSGEGDFWANVTGEVGIIFRDLISSVEKLGYSVSPVVIPACGLGAWHRRYRVWIMGHADSSKRRAVAEGRYESNRNNARRQEATGGLGLAGQNQSRERRIVRDAQRDRQHSEVTERERQILQRSVTDGASATLSDANGTRELQPQGRVQNQWRRTGDGGATLPDSQRQQSEGRRNGTKRRQWCASEANRDGGTGGRAANGGWAVEPDVGRVAYGIPSRLDRLRTLGNAIVPQVAFQLIKRMIESEQI